MNLKKVTLPKAVALTAFVIYALTLSRGMTLSSLPLTAKITGWDWMPMTSHPLTWLLTLPVHLLPTAWIPFALNLFSAATAALTLGLLARCVELIPWDVLPDVKKPWMARLPVLLAVTVCGFEFSFWQEATAMTGEMTDVMVLTAAVWCLLEYRASKKDLRWLDAAALAWGLGMVENWLMPAIFPLFVAALVALRKRSFLRLVFIRRMALFGLAGLSLYVVLPLAHCLTPHSPFNFGEAWLTPWRSTKGSLFMVYATFWQQHRLLIVAVLLYYLVPTMPCFLRPHTRSSAYLSALDSFQVRIYRALSVVLLLACVWLALDPAVGIRELVHKQTGLAMPLLSFSVVNALGSAFLLGNLLFAAQAPTKRSPRRLSDKLVAWMQGNAAMLLTLVSMLAVTGLVVRNLPAIRSFNRQPLSGFGTLMARSLPADGGIVLGNDQTKLTLLQAALADGKNGHWQFIDLVFYADPKYREVLGLRLPSDGSQNATGGTKDKEPKSKELMKQLDGLSRSNRIFFIEPQNGSMLYEQFYPMPIGALYELKHYDAYRFGPAPLKPQQVIDQEKFWDEAWRGGVAEPGRTPGQPAKLERLLQRRLTIVPARRDQTVQLGRWYSVALNDWGVALQQAGQFSAAQRRFEQALLLSTNNLAAATNLNVCLDLQAGKKLTLAEGEQATDQFRSPRELAQSINIYGEFDDPGIRCQLGRTWLKNGWPHQAWQEFEHARILAPEAVFPQLEQAELYLHFRFDAEVFETVGRLRPLVTDTAAGQKLEIELAMLEARSWISQTNQARANRVLEKLLLGHPESPMFAETVLRAYLTFGEISNAFVITTAQLAKDPDNANAINNQAWLLIQSRRASEAIPLLDRGLTRTNQPIMQLIRGMAYLAVTNLPAAEKDYTAVLDSTVDPYLVHSGLAQIALAKGDTNAAVRYYGLCLTNVPPDSLRGREVHTRMEALKH